MTGAAATPLVAIFARLVAFSGWRGSWYLYFLAPLVNIILFVVFGGHDPEAHYHKCKSIFSLYSCTHATHA